MEDGSGKTPRDGSLIRESAVEVPGFIDAHTHLLNACSLVGFPWTGQPLRKFHETIAQKGTTPMDILEPARQSSNEMVERVRKGLRDAAALGLVEVTEMGLRGWWYLDALDKLQAGHHLPVRVRIYLASGLASSVSLYELDIRRRSTGPWVNLDGIKFYCDGWLGVRTCAMCRNFEDDNQAGVLFMDAPTLARKIEPFAEQGWKIATHAIGDRAITTVLDAYELVWGTQTGALTGSGARLEHASLQSPELMERIAASGVSVCIQPSFAVTDAGEVRSALGSIRAATAYPWRRLSALGARLVAGTDYPIEDMDPLVGLARLVNGESFRPGFISSFRAPQQSRLDLAQAFDAMSDSSAGRTWMRIDPRGASSDRIDELQVLGTEPWPFRTGSHA